MESKIEKETKIILILTENEAMWLKALVQNPTMTQLQGVEEDDIDGEMRKKFFDALLDF